MKLTWSFQVLMLPVSHDFLRVSVKVEGCKSFNTESLSAVFPRKKMCLFTVSVWKPLLWNVLNTRPGYGYKQKSSFGKQNFQLSIRGSSFNALPSLPIHSFSNPLQPQLIPSLLFLWKSPDLYSHINMLKPLIRENKIK